MEFKQWLLQEERAAVDPAVLNSYENAFQQDLQALIRRTRDPELRQAFEDMRACPVRDQHGRCHRFTDYILGSLLRWGCNRSFDLEDAFQYIVFRMLSPVGERGLRRKSLFDFDESLPYDLRIGNPLQQIFRAYLANDLRSILGGKIKRIRTIDRPKGTVSIGTDPGTVSSEEIPGRESDDEDELVADIVDLLKRKSTPGMPLVDLFRSILRGQGTRYQRQTFGHSTADLGRKIIIKTIHDYATATENYSLLRLLNKIQNPEPRQPKPPKAPPKPEMPREERLFRSIVDVMEKHGRKVGSAILGKVRRRWVERGDPSGNHPNLYGDDYFSGLTTIRFPVEAIR